MTRVALESKVVPEARYLIRKSGSSGFESSGIMTHVQTSWHQQTQFDSLASIYKHRITQLDRQLLPVSLEILIGRRYAGRTTRKLWEKRKPDATALA